MKTDFILLSAGQSSRMGQDKAQLDFHGQPWLLEQATQIQSSGAVDRLVVVTQRERAAVYREILVPLQSSEFHAEVVENADPLSKPSDSIRCALRAAKFSSGAFISPIDVCQRAEIIRVIADSTGPESQIVKPAANGRTGHPIWMSQKMLGQFLWSSEARLDFFLNQHQNRPELVKIARQEILLNLNTIESWREFLTKR